MAPSYVDKQSLPFQEVEIEALSKLAGYRCFDGDFVSFVKLVSEVSTGFIHFSGHGEVNQPSSGRPVFAIDVVDQSLDPIHGALWSPPRTARAIRSISSTPATQDDRRCSAASCKAGVRRSWPAAPPASSAACGR